MKRLLLLALLSAPMLSARAQPEILALAPVQIGQDAWYATDPQVMGLTVTGQRMVPLFFFLPNVSEDSRFEVGTVKLGVRSGKGREASFAYSLRVLEGFVAKAPWAGGLTLLRYDRTGPLRLEADWLAIRFGPALNLGPIQARLIGKAGLSTVGTTGALFIGSDDSATGFEVAARAELIGRLSTMLTLGADASLTRLTAGENPTWRSWKAYLQINPEGVFAPRFGAGQLQLEADNYLSATEFMLSFGLVITPRKRDF
jgi:hypothetical protein